MNREAFFDCLPYLYPVSSGNDDDHDICKTNNKHEPQQDKEHESEESEIAWPPCYNLQDEKDEHEQHNKHKDSLQGTSSSISLFGETRNVMVSVEPTLPHSWSDDKKDERSTHSDEHAKTAAVNNTKSRPKVDGTIGPAFFQTCKEDPSMCAFDAALVGLDASIVSALGYTAATFVVHPDNTKTNDKAGAQGMPASPKHQSPSFSAHCHSNSKTSPANQSAASSTITPNTTTTTSTLTHSQSQSQSQSPPMHEMPPPPPQQQKPSPSALAVANGHGYGDGSSAVKRRRTTASTVASAASTQVFSPAAVAAARRQRYNGSAATGTSFSSSSATSTSTSASNTSSSSSSSSSSLSLQHAKHQSTTPLPKPGDASRLTRKNGLLSTTPQNHHQTKNHNNDNDNGNNSTTRKRPRTPTTPTFSAEAHAQKVQSLLASHTPTMQQQAELYIKVQNSVHCVDWHQLQCVDLHHGHSSPQNNNNAGSLPPSLVLVFPGCVFRVFVLPQLEPRECQKEQELQQQQQPQVEEEEDQAEASLVMLQKACILLRVLLLTMQKERTIMKVPAWRKQWHLLQRRSRKKAKGQEGVHSSLHASTTDNVALSSTNSSKEKPTAAITSASTAVDHNGSDPSITTASTTEAGQHVEPMPLLLLEHHHPNGEEDADLNKNKDQEKGDDQERCMEKNKKETCPSKVKVMASIGTTREDCTSAVTVSANGEQPCSKDTSPASSKSLSKRTDHQTDNQTNTQAVTMDASALLLQAEQCSFLSPHVQTQLASWRQSWDILQSIMEVQQGGEEEEKEYWGEALTAAASFAARGYLNAQEGDAVDGTGVGFGTLKSRAEGNVNGKQSDLQQQQRKQHSCDIALQQTAQNLDTTLSQLFPPPTLHRPSNGGRRPNQRQWRGSAKRNHSPKNVMDGQHVENGLLSLSRGRGAETVVKPVEDLQVELEGFVREYKLAMAAKHVVALAPRRGM